MKTLTNNLEFCPPQKTKLAIAWRVEEFSAIYIKHKPVIYPVKLRTNCGRRGPITVRRPRKNAPRPQTLCPVV